MHEAEKLSKSTGGIIAMKRVLSSALILGLIVFAGPRPAHASETDALLNKLIEKGILSNEEAQEVRNEMASDSS